MPSHPAYSDPLSFIQGEEAQSLCQALSFAMASHTHTTHPISSNKKASLYELDQMSSLYPGDRLCCACALQDVQNSNYLARGAEQIYRTLQQAERCYKPCYKLMVASRCDRTEPQLKEYPLFPGITNMPPTKNRSL